MSSLILLSPLQGWSAPLGEAPDPVFAERMLGDGLAIDPTGSILHAPCDGEIVTVAASKHALTLRADSGAEILMHVGIDTVGLKGEGFELHVRSGQRVRAGEPLLGFDLDLLARRAKSVLTPILITNAADFEIRPLRRDCEVDVGEPLMELVRRKALSAGTAPAHRAEQGTEAHSPEPGPAQGTVLRTVTKHVRVTFEHGIHARPAAWIADCARGFKAEVVLESRQRSADARSAVSLMTLGVHAGDEVTIRASGEDADAAAAALEALIGGSRSAEGDPGMRAAARAETTENISTPASASSPTEIPADGILRGVVASPGHAIGSAVRLTGPSIEVAEKGAGVEHEAAELRRARDVVRADLQRRIASACPEERDILTAHLALLDDPQLESSATAHIASGKSAGYAWREAVRSAAAALKALNDPHMAARMDDLRDIETQVLLALGGTAQPGARALPERAIVLAETLLPSQLAALDPSRLAGLCMAEGGPTSHVALLAAAMGVPALVGLGRAVLEIADATPLVLDAEQGRLHVNPEPAQIEAAEQAIARLNERRAAEQAAAKRESRTADGIRIEIFANVGSVIEAEAAVARGAEGCGLLRTEFLFLDRRSPPHEDEQALEYQRIATAFAGRPVVIRTLDAGGDKPIEYLPLPREENPALGLRGVRTSLWRPDLLRTQLRAILRVRPAGQCRVLIPMITDPAEIRAVRSILEELCREMECEARVPVGVMIETPAAALFAERIARHADFLSIGTNDLTQYVLAMDRGHPELAVRLDALHPAVLRLIATTVEGARAHGRTVAVCGGLASDPVALPVLIGLGVRELSVVPAAIARLKALIHTLDSRDCEELARHALELETAGAVRELVARAATREEMPS